MTLLYDVGSTVAIKAKVVSINVAQDDETGSVIAQYTLEVTNGDNTKTVIQAESDIIEAVE